MGDDASRRLFEGSAPPTSDTAYPLQTTIASWPKMRVQHCCRYRVGPANLNEAIE